MDVNYFNFSFNISLLRVFDSVSTVASPPVVAILVSPSEAALLWSHNATLYTHGRDANAN